MKEFEIVMDFDLQRFAEEEKTEKENTGETVAEPTQDGEGTQEPIPEELAGLDDNTARSVMEEARRLEQASEPPSEGQETGQQEETEPDGESGNESPGPIPYKRFKQVIDKGKEKDDEIARLKAELDALRQNPSSQQPRQETQPLQPPVQQPPKQRTVPQENGFALTPDNMELLHKAVQEEALRIAQMTKEDLDSMEYMEDGDPRKQRWQYAQDIAKSNVLDKIRQAQQMEMQRRQAFLAAHNASVADFNRYATEAQKAEDFEAVKNFAVNDFFKAIPSEPYKQVIATAYARVEQNTASPAEIYLIQDYFTRAQAEYRRQHPTAAPSNRKSQSDKLEQAKAFPKSQQVSGSGDAGGGITVASLEKMLNEMPFDQIEPKYQNMLLGIDQ